MHFDAADLAIKHHNFNGDNSSGSLNLLDIMAARTESQAAPQTESPARRPTSGTNDESSRHQEPPPHIKHVDPFAQFEPLKPLFRDELLRRMVEDLRGNAEKPRPEPRRPAQDSIRQTIEALPNHPMKDVMRELALGVLSGNLNQEQLAKEMKEFAAAVEKKDASGLPPILESDNIFAESKLEQQLYKAIEPLNKMLRERGLSIEFWLGGKAVVISTGYDVHPPTNIAVLHTGEFKPFTGRHPAFHPNEYKEIPLDQAVKALNKHASEYKPRRN